MPDKKKHSFLINDINVGSDEMFLIAGPCVIEDESLMLESAYQLKKIVTDLKVPTIFKSSFQKDNRSSLKGYMGPGLKAGGKILSKIKQEFNFPILSDVHYPDQVEEAAEFLDVIQLPAYLCMQTSLLVAAAKTGKVINIKHGQFLAPANMRYPLAKCVESGNDKVFLTERGYTFGYNDLVVDPRSFYELKELGYPVVFDVTHSVRKYGVPSDVSSGGARQYIPTLSRAAAAIGVDGFFIEVHPDPKIAKCDAVTQLPISELRDLLEVILDFHNLHLKHRNKNGIIS